MKCAGWKCCFSLVLGTILLAAIPLAAQQTPARAATLSSRIPLTLTAALAAPEPAEKISEKLEQLEKDVKAAQSAGDNAWMLVSAALVLMMTGAGLALFYGGVVRRK